MSRLDHWIDNKIVQNLFIWFCFFLILLSAVQAENRVLTSFYIILLLAPAIYISNFLVLPIFKKNTALFALLFVSNAFLFTGISVYFINHSLKQAFQWDKFVNFFGIMVLALAFGTAVKIARDSFLRRQEGKEAELKLLKAQLNPHFLFNTLNNLYGLSVVKSDKLPDLMLKLSDLLRYSLYETKDVFVSLDKEIQYLENYISLEKIRLEDKTNIELQVSGNIASEKIAPMLFIVFVENAFKHLGVLENGKSYVSIIISQEHDIINFKCENTIDKTEIINKDLEKGKSGIGLQNAKKRLSLLYSGKHNLKIIRTDTLYTVNLTLLK